MPRVRITADMVAAECPELTAEQAERLAGVAMETARRVAPCVDRDDFDAVHTATDILMVAVRRRASVVASTAAGPEVTQESRTWGPFSAAATYAPTTSRVLLFPREVEELQDLCRSVSAGRAWALDMSAPDGAPVWPPPGEWDPADPLPRGVL